MRRRLGLLALSLIVAGFLAELGDRVYLNWLASDAVLLKYGSIDQIRARGISDRFTPHPHLAYYPTPSWSRGIDRHNSIGFRGAEIAPSKPAGVFRIACLGGSTTYGSGVEDPAQAYPGALERELRTRGHAVEVINAGCPGWSSLQSLINLELRVLQLAPDVVIVYHGINDVHPRLVWPPEAYRRDQTGYIAPRLLAPRWWEASSVLRTVAVLGGLVEPEASLGRLLGEPPPTAYSIEFWRQTKDGVYPRGIFAEVSAAKMLAANGPIHFEENLRDIVTISRASGVGTIFMTWAYAAETSTGKRARLETEEYQKAIEEQNDVIRRLSAELAVPLLDLAAKPIPGDEFVDGYHFSAAGNRRRAAMLADLVERRFGAALAAIKPPHGKVRLATASLRTP